jgi:magnesium-transporting ATPase (P-type)
MAQVQPQPPTSNPFTTFTKKDISMFNVDQMTEENKEQLRKRGGVTGVSKLLHVDVAVGLQQDEEVLNYATRRAQYGTNVYPKPPIKSWCYLFVTSFNDPTLLILLAAAVISLIVGIIEHPEQGWIEGVTIFTACLIVAIVTATNDYEKDKQFRALKGESDNILVKVLRDGRQRSISTFDVNVGDVVILEAGDKVPGDAIFISGENCKSNESGLTGESDDKDKGTLDKSDPFLLSGCNLIAGRCHALCIAIGDESRWGRIKAKLAVEQQQTPLQEKLDRMAALIGYFGGGMALLTFIAMMLLLAADDQILQRRNMSLAGYIINAFIIAVTIVVVAIPEGLPLAVTISLAYSTKKMLKDKNLIRVLAACETMGNATNICSDKTGTLTENRMTVVAGWFADTFYDQEQQLPVFGQGEGSNGVLPTAMQEMLTHGLGCNSTAILEFDREKQKFITVGSKTDGALLQMVRDMGKSTEKKPEMGTAAASAYNAAEKANDEFYLQERQKPTSKVFSFNSTRKLSSILVPLFAKEVATGEEVAKEEEGNKAVKTGYRLYVKGASEIVLSSCKFMMNNKNEVVPLDDEKKKFLNADVITRMAKEALRTIAIGHVDFTLAEVDSIVENGDLSLLTQDWGYGECFHKKLILQAVVGIIDPLRDDVIDAVLTCQNAGIMVRMVTGDNLETAKAIAKKCGILTEGGIAMEGPTFRKMTPVELDQILPKLQVLARSSPDDKHTLVTRLNGRALPRNEEEWKEAHPDNDWDTERNLLLPGYWKEWCNKYGNDGEVVGVTGDGTNDAPALKAADVGLSMGLSGTDEAKDASDIVILDDRFSSIVKAVLWGRCVYDNIRKFLQFQLTVNVVALCLVFVAACLDGATPLNAIMMLWVNLIMDTMGALALGTEMPKDELLNRKPYKRSAPLVSKPMVRNILMQSIYQLTVLMLFLIHGKVGCFFWLLGSWACARDVGCFLILH